MKVLVDKMPIHPKECLFSGRKIEWIEIPRTGLSKYFLKPKRDIVLHWGCKLDCDFCTLREGKCNNLDIIEIV